MVDPRFMKFPDWANRSAPLFASYGLLPKVTTESEWKKWASNVVGFSQIAQTWSITSLIKSLNLLIELVESFLFFVFCLI